MAVMEPEPQYPPPWRRGGPLTRDDLDRMPDDGHRYELIDGALIMTPAPSIRHQDVVLNLALKLKTGCPADLKVMVAPTDVVISQDTIMQPDVLVARREDFSDRDLPQAPMLAVEVLSPSTRRIDVMLKFSRLEAAGCPSYWVVDPDTPELIVWELRDGAYAQVAKVVGEQIAELSSPFAVSIVPADLTL